MLAFPGIFIRFNNIRFNEISIQQNIEWQKTVVSFRTKLLTSIYCNITKGIPQYNKETLQKKNKKITKSKT